jgi:hypothetical protein
MADTSEYDYLDPNKKPGTGVPNVPGAPPTQAAPAPAAPAAPAAAAPAAPQPPPAPPTANDLILQHLGQGGIGSDRVAAPPRQDSWWDIVPGTKYSGEPAQPGQQSWFDWFSKKYDPSAADVGTAFGDAWSYGLSPLVAQGVKSGAQAVTGIDPLAAGLEPDALRERIKTANENVGPAGPLISLAGMAMSPLTYLGIGPETKVAGKVTEALAPDAAELAAKYAPRVAKYVPEQLFPNMVKGGTAAGTTAAAHEAGAGGSPTDIALAAAANIPVGAVLAGGASALPLGGSTPEDVINKTAQGVTEAQSQLSKIPVRTKDLGFKVGGAQNPSAAEVMDYQNWLKTVKPENDPAGAVPILQNRISQALSQGPVPAAVQQAQNAAQRAQMAQTLARWRDLQGQAGVDVKGEAGQAAENFPVGSPEREALKRIGATSEPSPLLSRSVRSGISALGAGAGEAANIAGGGHVPFGLGSASGAGAANWLANAFEDLRGGQSISPLVQQNIAKAYGPLTRQPAPGTGGNQALQNALLRLYGAGWLGRQ